MRALHYAIEEALLSLRRGRQAGALSTATIALALFVLGAFLLVTANLERLATEWSSVAEMSVYLKDDLSQDQRRAIEQALAPGEVIAAREYISKTDALARFRQTFSDLTSTVETLGENPLPASYEVRLRSGATVADSVDRLATQLRDTAGVADVRYDRQWLARLLSVVTIVRRVGLGLGALLTLAAALTVANVVRLALYARRDELEIMQLVGAPTAYIRGPFVMEGVMQGGLGAVVALAALTAAFFVVRGQYLTPLASAISLSSVRFLPGEVCVLLVVGGMVVGCIGGIVAAWRS